MRLTQLKLNTSMLSTNVRTGSKQKDGRSGCTPAMKSSRPLGAAAGRCNESRYVWPLDSSRTFGRRQHWRQHHCGSGAEWDQSVCQHCKGTAQRQTCAAWLACVCEWMVLHCDPRRGRRPQARLQAEQRGRAGRNRHGQRSHVDRRGQPGRQQDEHARQRGQQAPATRAACSPASALPGTGAAPVSTAQAGGVSRLCKWQAGLGTRASHVAGAALSGDTAASMCVHSRGAKKIVADLLVCAIIACQVERDGAQELHLVPAASKQARTAHGCVQAAQDSPDHGQQEVAVVPPADARAQEQAVMVLQSWHHRPPNHDSSLIPSVLARMTGCRNKQSNRLFAPCP